MNIQLYKTVENVNKELRYFLSHEDIISIMNELGGFKNKSVIIDAIEYYALTNLIPKF